MTSLEIIETLGWRSNLQAVSSEAERLQTVMELSPVAFAYFDASDRLVFWNTAYRELNFRISELVCKGALFADLLAELVLRGQIAVPEGDVQDWIARRLEARRRGGTAFRALNDGRTFLAQERKDELGGTLGFWVDVTDLFAKGVLKGTPELRPREAARLTDPGIQDRLRSQLQTVFAALEFMALEPQRTSDRAILAAAINSMDEIRACLDMARAGDTKADQTSDCTSDKNGL